MNKMECWVDVDVDMCSKNNTYLSVIMWIEYAYIFQWKNLCSIVHNDTDELVLSLSPSSSKSISFFRYHLSCYLNESALSHTLFHSLTHSLTCSVTHSRALFLSMCITYKRKMCFYPTQCTHWNVQKRFGQADVCWFRYDTEHGAWEYERIDDVLTHKHSNPFSWMCTHTYTGSLPKNTNAHLFVHIMRRFP